MMRINKKVLILWKILACRFGPPNAIYKAI